jgi:hypothetical protein
MDAKLVCQTVGVALIGKKNDELKQEVKWLRERLASLMGLPYRQEQ